MVTEIPAKVLFLDECRERLSQSLTYQPTKYKSVTYSGLIHVGVVFVLWAWPLILRCNRYQ